jgi:LPXTG-motif cell wall-anchored protein
MITKVRRLRFGAVASLLVAAGALLLAPAVNSQTVTAAYPAGDGDVCAALDSGKIDTTGDPSSVTYPAPDGYLVEGYCVKAGSVHQGYGPVYVSVDPPQKTVTITYPDKDSISHYSVDLVMTQGPTTTGPTTTGPTTTGPTTTSPETTGPTTTGPTTTDPETTGPTTTEPRTTEPAPAYPVTTPPSTGPGPNGGSNVAPAPVPTLAPPLGQLAETGTATTPIAVIAGSLLLGGALAVLVARRLSTR